MNINKNFLLLFLLLYTFFGIYLSISTGISHDEYHEQLNWEINLKGIKSFFSNGNYDILLDYKDKYYGIAFHLLSQPIQYFSHKYISNLNEVSIYGGYLISKHIVIFTLFSISSIFFYLLCFKLTNNSVLSILSSIIYIFYPYLFGHAQFNPKDIPFMSIWIINSYLFLTIIESFFYKEKIKINKIIIFSFFTAFLISIRITGVIIFIQYLVGFIILFKLNNDKIFFFLKKKYLIFLYFFLSTLLFIYLLNPVYWHNPFEMVNAIKSMGKYQQDNCTLTLGDCMRSLNLPASYYFIWFFFKLPILVLTGLILFPYVEKKIFSNKITSIYYGTFFFSSLIILMLFILKKIALYDEIRHIMFLLPMIFLVSLVNVFLFNKKFFYIMSFLSIIFFILENFSLNPYQYTWLNSFSKFTNIQKNFEIDYWGLSNKNLQKKIIEYSNNNSVDKKTCVYGDQYAKEFLVKKSFICFKHYGELDAAKNRPFFVYKNVRNVKRSNPKDCKMIWNESFNYTFDKRSISAGTLWFCD